VERVKKELRGALALYEGSSAPDSSAPGKGAQSNGAPDDSAPRK
jgi:hypothetical protein